MAIKIDSALIDFFKALATPSGAQFEDFIDSKRHVWDDWVYIGPAVTTTIPTIINRNVFYVASTPGTYTNIGGLEVYAGEVCFLKLTVNPTSGIGTWSKDTIFRPATVTVYANASGLAFLQPGADDSGATEPAEISLIAETNAPSPSYQWQYKATPADTWADIASETAATLEFDNTHAIWAGAKYVMIRCMITDSQGNVFTTNAVTCYTTEVGGSEVH